MPQDASYSAPDNEHDEKPGSDRFLIAAVLRSGVEAVIEMRNGSMPAFYR